MLALFCRPWGRVWHQLQGKSCYSPQPESLTSPPLSQGSTAYLLLEPLCCWFSLLWLLGSSFSGCSSSLWASQIRADIVSVDLMHLSILVRSDRRYLHWSVGMIWLFAVLSMESQEAWCPHTKKAHCLSWKCFPPHLLSSLPTHKSCWVTGARSLCHLLNLHWPLNQWSYVSVQRSWCALPGTHRSQNSNRQWPIFPLTSAPL